MVSHLDANMIGVCVITTITIKKNTHNCKNFKLKKINGEQPAMSVTGTTIQTL